MMKKQIMIMGLAMTALLCGCGRTGSAGTGLAGGSGEETGISNGSGEDTGISNETEVNSEDAGTEGRPGGNGTSTDGGERVSGNGKVSGKEREAAENGGETGGNWQGRNVCRLKGGWLLQAPSPGKAPQRPAKLGVLQGLAGKKDATQRYGLL